MPTSIPPIHAAERYAEKEEKRFDENLQTQELKDLLDLLQQGDRLKQPELEQARLKARAGRRA